MRTSLAKVALWQLALLKQHPRWRGNGSWKKGWLGRFLQELSQEVFFPMSSLGLHLDPLIHQPLLRVDSFFSLFIWDISFWHFQLLEESVSPSASYTIIVFHFLGRQFMSLFTSVSCIPGISTVFCRFWKHILSLFHLFFPMTLWLDRTGPTVLN